MQFVDILNDLRIPFQQEGDKGCRPGWYNLICPWCHGRDGDKFYLGYNIEKNFATCWTCGGHPLSSILTEITGKNYREIKALLGDLDRPTRDQPESQRGTLVLPLGIDGLLPAHKSYLRRRGFSTGRLERLWRIRGIGPVSALAWRIFIPVIFRGETVSFLTRAIVDTTPLRYISSSASTESLPHKKLLYGEDYARHAIIVNEGPLDAWAIGPGAVATMGAGFSTAQVLRISKYPRRIICFDAEPAAQARARMLCDQLEVFPGETINIELESAKDTAAALLTSAGRREIRQIRKFLD